MKLLYYDYITRKGNGLIMSDASYRVKPLALFQKLGVGTYLRDLCHELSMIPCYADMFCQRVCVNDWIYVDQYGYMQYKFAFGKIIHIAAQLSSAVSADCFISSIISHLLCPFVLDNILHEFPIIGCFTPVVITIGNYINEADPIAIVIGSYSFDGLTIIDKTDPYAALSSPLDLDDISILEEIHRNASTVYMGDDPVVVTEETGDDFIDMDDASSPTEFIHESIHEYPYTVSQFFSSE